jgi:hypothetical protein
MSTRAAFLSLAFLAGCATAARDPSPDPAPATREAVPRTVETAGPRPSDWALAVIGTPFVFAFRVVACAATAVVAAPTAGLLTLAPDPQPGLAYLRDGLGQNCGPPYAMPVPVAAEWPVAPNAGYLSERAFKYPAAPDVLYYPAPGVRHHPEPDLGRPRTGPDMGRPRVLTPYSGPAVPAP